MKKLLTSLAVTAALLASPATAACYADYKAKQDNPLRLHYGVIELADGFCGDRGAARGEIAQRLEAAGWKLLRIQSIFGSDGLKEREASAGRFYLRF